MPYSLTRDATQTEMVFALMCERDRKYIRHVYLLTDAATPVAEVSQLGDIVGMYTDPTMECR